MTKRIFRSIFLTSLAAILLVSAFIIITLYNAYENSAMKELKTQANHISAGLSLTEEKAGFFEHFYSADRITLIAPDGKVLYDNTTDASGMENHADRPEVISALKNGWGESYRVSATLSEKTLYYAVRTSDGYVLRTAKMQESVFGLLWSMLSLFFIILTGVAILSVIAARLLTKRIIAPINELNLDAPFENEAYDELSPLLLRIERQHREIEKRLNEITGKQREFAAVTENMREGLVLLSDKGDILSINRSALNIFSAGDEVCLGNHILSLNRSVELQSVVEGALRGDSTQAQLSVKGRHYQIHGNPVDTGDGARGAAILVLDVSDRRSAERSRREFTANVSHELKTPLTSISGFAEIMMNGTARTEDMRDFAARIHGEATRLIALIEDIISLSQLDEQEKLPDKELVDLFVLAQDVCARLEPLAYKQNVSLTVNGESVAILGYHKILGEMIYNLCDNAIKYNTAGGGASVTVAREGDKAVVTVRDTGIGIPPEHHKHVFERFYRVDKSRSKQTGGTGLGLAIVKHGAAMHKARIELLSEENKGTSIKIIFPEK